MIAKITAAYVRHYRDNNQITAYIAFVDAKGRSGRVEGRTCSRKGEDRFNPAGPHMQALFARAKREGVTVEQQIW